MLLKVSSAWNCHPIRTEHNWIPLRIWANDMIDLRNRELKADADIAEYEISRDDLEWYAFDPQAPHPTDDGLQSFFVDDVSIEIPRELLEQLARRL